MKMVTLPHATIPYLRLPPDAARHERLESPALWCIYSMMTHRALFRGNANADRHYARIPTPTMATSMPPVYVC